MIASVALLVSSLALPVTAEAAGNPAAAATFSWRLQPRTHRGEHYHSFPMYGAYDVASTPNISFPEWLIDVDACATGTMRSYTFKIDATGSVIAHDGVGCQQTLHLPTNAKSTGSWTIRLEAVDSANATSTTTRAVAVRDFLVVSLGDSYGSGEGDPDDIVTGDYQDNQCDRSAWAPASRAAYALEESYSDSSVTFIHLNCAGATIHADYPEGGGVLSTYEGMNPSGLLLPPQVTTLDELLSYGSPSGKRRIDALTISAGGNDMGFSTILELCMLEYDCQNNMARSEFNYGRSILPAQLERLSTDLGSRYSSASREVDPVTGQALPVLSPESVIRTGYPDPAIDDNPRGHYCDWWSDPLDNLAVMSESEYKWASDVVVPSLNAMIRHHAERQGWRYVSGIEGAFYGHGYCASSGQRWMTQLNESLLYQGNANGTMHPNSAGQRAIADLLYADLHDVALLAAQPNRFSVKSNYAHVQGSNGWETGQTCPPAVSNCPSTSLDYLVTLDLPAGLKPNHTRPLDQVVLTVDGSRVLVSSVITPGSVYACDSALLRFCQIITSPTSASWPTRVQLILGVSTPGTHRISVTATDLQNRVVSGTFDAKLDPTPPTLDVGVDGTQDGTGWITSLAKLWWDYRPDPATDSGFQRVDVVLKGEGADGKDLLLSSSSSASQFVSLADGMHTATVTAYDKAGLSTTKTVTAKVDTTQPMLVPVTPYRILDTRGGPLLQPGQSREVQIAGRAGVPASGAGAVALNVTSDASSAAGHITVFPCGSAPPTSSLNFPKSANVANAVITPLSANGTVCFSSNVTTNVIADISAWSPTNSDLKKLTPARLFDTRDGSGGVPARKLAAGETLRYRVIGKGGVPFQPVAGVALNVTVEGPAAAGHITVFPCGNQPTTSNSNYVAGQTKASMVLAPVNEAGEVCFYAHSSTNLIVDVSAWFPVPSEFRALTPARLVDTRFGTGGVPIRKLNAFETLTFTVAGKSGIPAAGAAVVALNVTAEGPEAAGHVIVYPCGTRPNASNLNYSVGQTVPNMVVAPVSASGQVCFYTNAKTNLIVDVTAWFPTNRG